MNRGMASLGQAPSIMSIRTPQAYPQRLKILKVSRILHTLTFPHIQIRSHPVGCTKLSQWEPSPVTYAPTEKTGDNFLEKRSNIFDTLDSDKGEEAPVIKTEDLANTTNQVAVQFQFLKWPMWLLGPSLLLATGMVPSLWLPISSIFLGPNMVSLLSLVGLDFIFNLGATLFLLMADSCARSKNLEQASNSAPPFSYKFWNIVATLTGLITPLLMLFGSQKGFLEPQLSFISFAVLLGPYVLLLSVQILTEMLTWHWQSPVWLVTPIVYEAYRVLQLMRGLKLAAEVTAPTWMLHTIRGLVCWWVLILGVQLMRVAWFAGFTARARQQWFSASPSANAQ
ncbi:hypothetical protein SLEP1_g2713 [Rubroshorea leprosula]|uniref:Cytochrome P450 family protein n=1 Tax=Rubroshorea leprosula TaxID=152421 RepID=A0AAV5HP08_9ROSI|nr:hypothetical protein SLEP1_g2713 [Rubroshorea leprosula]